MADNPDAVRSWAAAHASTVAAVPGNVLPPAVPVPGPVTLASVTEVATWPAGGHYLAVTGKPLADDRLLLAAGGSVVPATDGSDNVVRIRDLATGQTLRTLAGHTGRIYALAWGNGPNGWLLATSGADGTARIWDPGTGATLHTLTGHDRSVFKVAWGSEPDGRLVLATCGADGTARIWDPGTGETLRTLAGHTTVDSVAWGTGPDGRLLLATAGRDNTARIWDPGTGQVLHTLTGHTDDVIAVAWGKGPGGQLLATAGRDGTVRIWRPEHGEFAAQALDLQAGEVYCVAWAPLADGRMLLAATTRTGLTLWDGYSGQLLHAEEGTLRDAGVNHLGWARAPDGRLLLVTIAASDDVCVREVTLSPPERPAAPAPVRPETELVLESAEDITASIFGASTRRHVARSLASIRIPDGRVLLATIDSASNAQIWELTTGQPVGAAIGNMRLSPAWGLGRDERPLLAAAADPAGTVRICDPGTGGTLRILGEQGTSIATVAWGNGPDGQLLLATNSIDRTARIWDPSTGEVLHVLTGHTGPVNSVALGNGPDGRLLLATVGSDDQTARIWDAGTGEALQVLVGHVGSVYSVAWGNGPDGRLLLASGGSDTTARIWDPDTGETLHVLSGHSSTIHSLAWGNGPDGQLVLASGSADHTVRIWDPGTGAELGSIPGFTGSINNSVAWVQASERDLLLLMASDTAEGPVQAWRVSLSGGAMTRPAADRHPVARAWRPTQETAGVLALGSVALWPPAGLTVDLLTVTGPDPDPDQLNDPRLGVLAGEPGIVRLRELGWDRPARLAFAALLAAGLEIPARYVPPAAASPAELRDELRAALAAQSGPARSSGISVAAVRAATARITGGTATLLAILGPRACATDPLLPLRLARHAPRLAALTSRQLQLITPRPRPDATRGEQGLGTLVYSPGTAGVSRAGPLNRLLPSQLALPGPLLTLRLAEDQLLYRQHRAPAPPAPRPVTLVLDTTPPTYGPAGETLRLAAHLITITSWNHGHHPALVTLTDPARISWLAAPADLVHLWTSMTLDEPAPVLSAALATAATAGFPVVFLTHHHTADGLYRPAGRTLLLTTHQPPETPPPVPASPYHYHLPPSPTQAQLARVITALLSPAGSQSRLHS